MPNPSICKDYRVSKTYVFVCDAHKTYVTTEFQSDNSPLDTIEFCDECRDEYIG
jgi:hypothetical protein